MTIIGVEWNQGTDTWTRIDVDGEPLEAPDFDAESPWKDIVRCTLAADGSENHVSANGKGDDIILDGSDGRVMVRIPKFWVKSDSPSANVYRWWISSAAYAGFVVHPAFYQRGNTGAPADYIYVGAYEAGDDGANKLRSQTGDTVTHSQTIATFRTWAENIGVQWGITSIWALSAIKLLYYVEYADANSQTTIGKGIVTGFLPSATGADGIDANLATNGTGAGTGADGSTPIAYRGMENIWGNLLQFIDGYNAVDGSDEAHVKYRLINRDGTGTFADILADGDYEESSDLALSVNGYIKNIVWEDLLSLQFIGNDNTGTSDSYLCDKVYIRAAGDTTILSVAGYRSSGDEAGIAYLYTFDLVTVAVTSHGGRLEFIPPPPLAPPLENKSAGMAAKMIAGKLI